MPCWTVSNTTLDLGLAQAHNLDTLAEALRGLGYDVTINGDVLFCYKNGQQFTVRGGQMTGRSGSIDADTALQIKRAYTTTVVKKAALKFGGKVTALDKNKTKLRVTIR